MFCVKVHQLDESTGDECRVIRGSVHLFRDVSILPEATTSEPQNSCDQNICILGVPCSVEPDDFVQCTSSCASGLTKLRFVRNDVVQVILLEFDSHESAGAFYRFFNADLLPVKVSVCHVFEIATVLYTKSAEEASEPPPCLTEIPTCTACLERLEEHISGIPTTFQDTFSPRVDSCLVCRYCTASETAACSLCSTTQNLWACIICGFLGCGRYKQAHAIEHWKQTKHSYSLELESQQIWDYVGDMYVYRFIQSKTDGTLVEVSGTSGAGEDCSSCSRRSEASDLAYKSKLESLEYEYNSLLAFQSESQRKYYEERLAQVQQEQEKEKAAAIEKLTSVRLQKQRQKLKTIEEEKKLLEQLNDCFADNIKRWEQKVHDFEESSKTALKRKDDQVAELEKQVQVLMERMSLTSGQT